MKDQALRLHVQYIPMDPEDAALWPRDFALPPLLKGWPQPVELGDLIEPAPGSIWRIVQRKWRSASPSDVHLTLWVEPVTGQRHQGPALASLPPVTLH